MWSVPAGAINRLYNNNRDGTFTDVTEHSGLGPTGWPFAVAVGDFNNDGYDLKRLAPAAHRESNSTVPLYCCTQAETALLHSSWTMKEFPFRLTFAPCASRLPNLVMVV